MGVGVDKHLYASGFSADLGAETGICSSVGLSCSWMSMRPQNPTCFFRWSCGGFIALSKSWALRLYLDFEVVTPAVDQYLAIRTNG